jgi:hypothetical protein
VRTLLNVAKYKDTNHAISRAVMKAAGMSESALNLGSKRAEVVGLQVRLAEAEEGRTAAELQAAAAREDARQAIAAVHAEVQAAAARTRKEGDAEIGAAHAEGAAAGARARKEAESAIAEVRAGADAAVARARQEAESSAALLR